MKRIILAAAFLFTSLMSYAQVYQEDFETYSSGNSGSAAGYTTKTLYFLDTASRCAEGATKLATTLIDLNSGINTIAFNSAGGDLPSPSLDRLEVVRFTPAMVDLALTKQRIMPGESIRIIASGDKPMIDEVVIGLSVTGLDPASYTLSAEEIVVGIGESSGFVIFTPDEGLGEVSVDIALTNISSNDVVFGENTGMEAYVTSIPHTFYVSSSEGDDANEGTSSASPLKTLTTVTKQGQITGDHIRFKSGDRFEGRLVITASGTEGEPMTISNYGDGEKPVLDGSVAQDGRGSFLETILIQNQDHIHISNLEIQNPRQSSRPGAPDTESFGIYLINDGSGILRDFEFRNLTLRNIFSVANINEVPFDAIRVTGIMAETLGNNPGTMKYMADILVEDCYFSRIGKLGFWSRRMFSREETIARDSIKHRDIIFRNNTVFENGGSGIVLSNTLNALVESNTFEFTGSSVIADKMIGRGSGAWFFQCTNVVAQYNVSRHARGQNDSYGMHIDYGNKNVLFQYNYSEDSEGGFVEILGDNLNSIWRYNISVNDGLRTKKGNTLWISDYAGKQTIRSTENYIYNNSVYVGNGFTPDISIVSNDAYIYNNIFQSVNGSPIGETTLIDIATGVIEVSNNMFDGEINTEFTGLDDKAVFTNPYYIQPGKLDPEGYRLLKGSLALKGGEERVHPPFPAAGTGIFANVQAVPTTDFFGNSLVDEKGEPLTPIGAYAGKHLKIEDLKVSAICGIQKDNQQKWALFNPNSYAVSVSWNHLNSDQQGDIYAAPGYSHILIERDMKADIEKVIIEWQDEKGKTRTAEADSKSCDNLSSSMNNTSGEGDFVNGLDMIYPNPVDTMSTLNLLVSARVHDEIRVMLFHLDGRDFGETNHQVSPGKTLIQLDLNSYDIEINNIIFIKVTIGSEEFVQQLLVL